MSNKNEWVLAKTLRDCCDTSGREKHPQESAKILHQIGLAYRQKSPDKQSLIQSVALMTSAIMRDPDNKDLIERDMEEVCGHVLELAQARNKDFPFDGAVIDIKKKIAEMRQKAKQKLESIDQIPDYAKGDYLVQLQNAKVEKITTIQKFVTEQYTAIMKSISEKCIAVIGDTPCKYSLVGMGSLAKKEITPYSDFESIIVLEEGIQIKTDYEKILDYFRWFATIFQILLVRLGETILRFLAIPCLNSPFDKAHNWFYDAYTTCGICPDGFAPTASKNPLGRQTTSDNRPCVTELIKPVSEMVKYLGTGEDLNDEYHLSDVLSKNCFVSGDRCVYDDFASQVAEITSRAISVSHVVTKLRADVEEFSIGVQYKLRSAITLDVKRLIFRGLTLFVSTLGRLFGVKGHSCADIMNNMLEMSYVSESDHQKIMFAAAIACEVRLRFYTGRQSQSDFIWYGEAFYTDIGDANKLAKDIGVKSLIDGLVTGVSLQQTFSKLCDESWFSSDLVKFNLIPPQNWLAAFLCQQMRLFDKALELCSSHLCQSNDLTREGDRDFFIVYVDSLRQTGQVAKAVVELQNAIPVVREKQLLESLCEMYRILGECLLYFKKPKKALKLFRNIESLKYRGLYHFSEFDMDLYVRIANCFKHLGRFRKAVKYYDRALVMTNVPRLDFRVVAALHGKGECLTELQHYQEAIDVLEECVILKMSFAPNVDLYDPWTFDSLSIICECHLKLGEHEKAFQRLQETWIRTSCPDDHSRIVPERQYLVLLIKCMLKLGHSKDEVDGAIQCLTDSGISAIKQKHVENALKCWEECLELENQRDNPEFTTIAISLERIGLAHFMMKDFAKAFLYLSNKKVLSFYELSASWHPDKCRHYFLIGSCLARMKRYENAVSIFEPLLKVLENKATGRSYASGSIKQEALMELVNICDERREENMMARSFEAIGQHDKAVYLRRLAWNMTSVYDEPNAECASTKMAELDGLANALFRTKRFSESIAAALEGLALALHYSTNPAWEKKVRSLSKRLACSCLKLKLEHFIPPSYQYTPSVYYRGMQNLDQHQQSFTAPPICEWRWNDILQYLKKRGSELPVQT